LSAWIGIDGPEQVRDDLDHLGSRQKAEINSSLSAVVFYHWEGKPSVLKFIRSYFPDIDERSSLQVSTGLRFSGYNKEQANAQTFSGRSDYYMFSKYILVDRQQYGPW